MAKFRTTYVETITVPIVADSVHTIGQVIDDYLSSLSADMEVKELALSFDDPTEMIRAKVIAAQSARKAK